MRKQISSFASIAFRRLFVPFAILSMLGLAAFDTVPKDQGIGGTGQIFRGDDQGLTGTGYFGTISDFGSIIINGREIEIGDAIIVKIDGIPAKISDLKIGQVIAARSVVLNALEQIQSVEVLHAVIGPLDSIDPVTGLGTVLGQVVDFNSRIDHETLNKHDWIAVSGLRTQSGVIVASRVEKNRNGALLVQGDSAQIKEAFAALHLPPQPIPSGSSLVMSGVMVSGRPQIQSVRQVPLTKLLSNTKTILVETYLPTTEAGKSRSSVTLLGEKLVIKNTVSGTLPSSQTRQVLEGVNRNGQMLVTRTTPAPFDDRPSATSIRQTSLEGSSKTKSGVGSSSSSSESGTATSDTQGDTQGPEGETGTGQKGDGGGGSTGGDKGGGDKGGDKSEKD